MNLAHLLATNHITQPDLADALGLDQSTVSKKVTGSRPWKLDELRRLRTFLRKRGLTLSYDQLIDAITGEAA
jgi:predicted transcriptional regulator